MDMQTWGQLWLHDKPKPQASWCYRAAEKVQALPSLWAGEQSCPAERGGNEGPWNHSENEREVDEESQEECEGLFLRGGCEIRQLGQMQ